MKLLTFAIYDNATKIYAQPFYMVTMAAAIRAFQQLCQDDTSQIGKFPTDYHLFQLGEYDDHSGQHENLLAPSRVASALEFTKPISIQKTQLSLTEQQVEQGA